MFCYIFFAATLVFIYRELKMLQVVTNNQGWSDYLRRAKWFWLNRTNALETFTWPYPWPIFIGLYRLLYKEARHALMQSFWKGMRAQHLETRLLIAWLLSWQHFIQPGPSNMTFSFSEQRYRSHLGTWWRDITFKAYRSSTDNWNPTVSESGWKQWRS